MRYRRAAALSPQGPAPQAAHSWRTRRSRRCTPGVPNRAQAARRTTHVAARHYQACPARCMHHAAAVEEPPHRAACHARTVLASQQNDQLHDCDARFGDDGAEHHVAMHPDEVRALVASLLIRADRTSGAKRPLTAECRPSTNPKSCSRSMPRQSAGTSRNNQRTNVRGRIPAVGFSPCNNNDGSDQRRVVGGTANRIDRASLEWSG